MNAIIYTPRQLNYSYRGLWCMVRGRASQKSAGLESLVKPDEVSESQNNTVEGQTSIYPEPV